MSFRSLNLMKEAEQGLSEVGPDKTVDGEVNGGIKHE